MEENVKVALLTKTKKNGWNKCHILISKQFTNNAYLICGSGCKAVSNWVYLHGTTGNESIDP